MPLSSDTCSRLHPLNQLMFWVFSGVSFFTQGLYPLLQHKPSPRIFIGPCEISGMYRGLKMGLIQKGLKVTFVNFWPHAYGYGGHDPLWLVERIIGAEKALATATRKTLPRLTRRYHFWRWALFWWATSQHDVFIFGFHHSLVSEYRDLPILKALGKRIIFQCHGSDSRPPLIDGAVRPYLTSETEYLSRMQEKKRTIQQIEAFADVVIDIPHQALLREKPFILWLKLGLPYWETHARQLMDESVNRVKTQQETQTFPKHIRILHCPSAPTVKGTAIIEEAISELAETLKPTGITLELMLLTNQPNQVIMQALADCDLVIDQLYADYAMPGFATEAAWFGKAVLIGGYGQAIWQEILAPEETPPTCYIHPDDLKTSLYKLITDHAYRLDCGLKLRHFVETRWAIEQTVSRYLTVIEGKAIPADWWYDPKHINYVEGVGLSQEHAQEIIQRALAEFGDAVLCLDDKPQLKQRFLDFAQTSL